MSFDEPQKTLIFELLDLFQGGTFDWVDYNTWVGGQVTSVPFKNQLDFALVTTLVTDTIAAIVASGDGREARIKTVIAEYDDISLDTIEVGAGGGGGASGARYSSSKQKRHLKQLLQRHMGIRVRMFGAAQGEIGGNNVRSIRVTR